MTSHSILSRIDSSDYQRNLAELTKVLKPVQDFLPHYFREATGYSISGYAINALLTGETRKLSQIDVWLLHERVSALGVFDDGGAAEGGFLKALDVQDKAACAYWFAKAESNLVRSLQIFNRIAKHVDYPVNPHIYDFKNKVVYYGYFEGGEEFEIHELDFMETMATSTIEVKRAKWGRLQPKLTKLLKKSGCHRLTCSERFRKKFNTALLEA